ncbi:MAG: hypothetical protein FWD68_21975 [Alphaproteobacteria bacterium]|nr:hypothetical protein [Alphaproteobacteria bacterium]
MSNWLLLRAECFANLLLDLPIMGLDNEPNEAWDDILSTIGRKEAFETVLFFRQVPCAESCRRTVHAAARSFAATNGLQRS